MSALTSTCSVVFGCALLLASTMAYVSELFLEDEEPAGSHLAMAHEDKVTETGLACRMTVPHTLIGRCRQLGRSGTLGCVAGHYLDPMHPDCQ